jgi:uroporphyrinogen decarboxylase
MSEPLSSVERTYRTLRGEALDRVPVSLPNFLVTARRMAPDSFADFFHDGEAMAEGQIEAWRRFGHDVLILENGTAALAEACGVRVIYQSETAPVAKEPAIRSLDEVDRLQIPDPYQNPILSELLIATRIVVKETAGKAFVMGRADQGPFSLACEIRGMEQFMLDLAGGEELEKVHRLLDYCRQVVTRFALAQAEQGAHCTSIGDSPSGPDVLSPRFYRKFAWPYVRQMADELKSKGVLLSYHICGNATPIIADMVASGAPMLEIDQKADQKTCKAAAGGKATLVGPVDPNTVMALGKPADVLEACRVAVGNLSQGGGFILGPGCALPATTPDENIDAMVEAARRFLPQNLSGAKG